MSRASRPGGKLTELEIAVLRLAADGHSYQAIGKFLRRSTAAVQDARQRAVMKLGASSAAHAVLLACRAGILDGRPQRHGDHAGYEAHRRRGEDPKACKQGCWAGEREYRNRQRRLITAKGEPPAIRSGATKQAQRPPKGRKSVQVNAVALRKSQAA